MTLRPRLDALLALASTDCTNLTGWQLGDDRRSIETASGFVIAHCAREPDAKLAVQAPAMIALLKDYAAALGVTLKVAA